MPKVTKHKNTVDVEYTPRSSSFTITKSEHDLIIAMQAHYAQMVKFILGQYSLDLYDAEQVVDAVIEAHAVNIAGSGNRGTVEVDDDEQETDWSKVPEGTCIYVRDCEDEDWRDRRFIREGNSAVFPFICRTKDDSNYSIGWKYAKLNND